MRARFEPFFFVFDFEEWLARNAVRMYVLPSVSTFTDRNPSVTRFQYDRDTFELLDYTVRVVFSALNLQAVLTFAYHRQVYFTNLSQANAHDAAEFVEFYSAKSYFEMPDLSPKRYRYHLLSCVHVDNADAAGVARLAPF